MVGRLLANRTISPFSGAAGMPRNQGLACVGITGCFASECPAGIRRNTQWERIMVLSWPMLIAQVVVVCEWPTVEQTAGLSL